MTDASASETIIAAPQEAGFGDFVQLMKPRVMTLVVFTAAVGLLVAPVPVHPFVALVSILFIAIGGGASGALNMWYEADIDAIMRRTKGRPIPSGRVTPGEATRPTVQAWQTSWWASSRSSPGASCSSVVSSCCGS